MDKENSQVSSALRRRDRRGAELNIMDFSLITYHFIVPMLEFFKVHLGNYGWAIIAVTIIVKVILYPLTKQQTASMQRMQALQPKIKIVQDRFNQQKERYKDRPAKLKEVQSNFQKEMMEFYQTHKVNPLGGCFPMLLQLPILIALFWAFNGSPFKSIAVTAPIEILTSDQALRENVKGSSSPVIFVGKDGKKGRLVLNPGEVKIQVNKEITYMLFKLEGEVNHLPSLVKWEFSDRPYYTQGYIPKNIEHFASLSLSEEKTNVIVKAKNPGRIYLNAILPGSSQNDRFLFISGLGKTGAFDPQTGRLNIDVIILVFFFSITIWLSGKVTSGYSPPPADPKQAEMQKTMQKMMPPMVGVMTLMFPVPAGVLLYFVVSGLIQVIQTWMVMRKPIMIHTHKEENPTQNPQKVKSGV